MPNSFWVTQEAGGGQVRVFRRPRGSSQAGRPLWACGDQPKTRSIPRLQQALYQRNSGHHPDALVAPLRTSIHNQTHSARTSAPTLQLPISSSRFQSAQSLPCARWKPEVRARDLMDVSGDQGGGGFRSLASTHAHTCRRSTL